MKYLKRFNEGVGNYGDEYQISWAGSLLAFNNPEIPKDPKTEPIPLKQSFPYKCLDCNSEYFFMKEDGEPTCPICKSKNSENINIYTREIS